MLTQPGSTPELQDVDDPVAAGGSVVAEVLAAGMNPVDRLLASADADPTVPQVAGTEGVARLQDGSRVYFASAVEPQGSFAERTLIDPDAAFPLPDALDDGLAVALGIAGLAAWLPLTRHAEVTSGTRVLVLGATGVAGQLAVQAAKLLGAADVVAAGRDADALELLRERGADALVVLGDDPGAALGEAAGEDGFDVVLDYVFGPVFEAAVPHLATGGTIVVVGAGAGGTAELDFRAAQGKTVVAHGNNAMALDVRRDAYAELAAHAAAGRLTVDVERFGLEQAADAWERQGESPNHKLVVVP